MASGATPWFTFFSFSFSVTPSYSASLVGLSEEIETLLVLSLPTFATSSAVLAPEPEGMDARITGG